jgi:hypothetical protein
MESREHTRGDHWAGGGAGGEEPGRGGGAGSNRTPASVFA